MPASEPESSPVPDSTAMPQHSPTLFVDLDGTLIASDSLWDSVALALRSNPLAAFGCLIAGLWGVLLHGEKGKAALKERFAVRYPIRPEDLPIRQDVLAYLQTEKASGRSIVLASAANHRLVESVGNMLGIFDAVIGSSATQNLKGASKFEAIQALLEARGSARKEFAYMGNAAADIPVWNMASEVLIVGSAAFCKSTQARYVDKPTRCFVVTTDPLASLLRLLRPHQWAKNALLLIPVLAAHNLQWATWVQVLIGAAAFCCVASATYVINDLLDLQADRQHPRKRQRPLASGAVGAPVAFLTAVLLAVAGTVLSLALPQHFLLALVAYAIATLLYSVWLKRQSIIDVIVLAGLYTLRILAGGLAAGISVSNWLLALSIFLFLSLALVKRCAELLDAKEAGKLSAAGRGYHIEDIATLRSIGITSGFIAVLVLALYIDRPQVAALYAHASVLWLALPIVAGWLMRLWIETTRGNMHDDPLVYAFQDRISQIVALALAATALIASGKAI